MIVSSDAETLDPRYATDPIGVRVTRLIHAGLVRLESDGLIPVPYMARSWTWVDPRTLDVELQTEARFHSGASLSPADVVATIRAFQSKTVGSRHARVVDAIDEVEARGEKTVRFHLARPHATLLTDLELPILRADQATSSADANGSLDGLGPYTVSRREAGTIELCPAANARKRATHAIVIRTVRDENARALRLFAGRADIAINQISPTLLPALQQVEGLGVRSTSGANLTYLVVRHGKGPLSEVNVRRAISLGIDRPLIGQALLGGHVETTLDVFPSALWAHGNRDSPLAMRNPNAARALLQSSGHNRLRFSLYTSTDRLRQSIARTMAQELAEIGIDLDITPLEVGTMMARLTAGDFELAMLQIPEMTEPNVLRHFLHSAFVPPQGANRGRVQDRELDLLIERGAAESDQSQRSAVYRALESRILSELPIIPLWHEKQVVITSQRARRFEPSSEGRWLSLADIP